MCFDPVTAAVVVGVATGALSAAASAVSGYAQTKSQNEAAVQQYKYQQQQQRLVNQAAVDNFNESLSRQRVEQLRAGQQSMQNAQQQILENQRRQSTAVANAATSGVTGLNLGMLFNEYQVSTGNISTNLQDTYHQLNENAFFNADNIRRENQSRINQAVPAKPYLAKFNILPSLLSGAATGLSAGMSAYGAAGGGTKQPTNTTQSSGYGASGGDYSAGLLPETGTVGDFGGSGGVYEGYSFG